MANISDAVVAPEADEKRKVADKTYIDATGAAVTQAEATGVTYKSLEDGKVAVYQVPDAVPGSVQTMFAVFGVGTLMTNTSSQNRQAKKRGEEGMASDIDAIDERLALVTDGDWGVERGGGFGRGIDTEVLLAAIRAAIPAIDDAKAGEISAKLAKDATYRRDMRNHPEVAAGYDELLRAKKAPVNAKPLSEII